MSLDSREAISQPDAKEGLGRSFVRIKHEETGNPDPTAVNAIGNVVRSEPPRAPTPEQIDRLLNEHPQATAAYESSGMLKRKIFDILSKLD